MKKKFIEKLEEATGCNVLEKSSPRCPNGGETPCFGTPDEVLKLMEAGYTHHLDFGEIRIGKKGSISPPVFIATPKEKHDQCIFFKDGICSLHSQNLMPAQGRISCRKMINNQEDTELCPLLLLGIIREWTEPENRDTVAKITLLSAHEKLKIIKNMLMN